MPRRLDLNNYTMQLVIFKYQFAVHYRVLVHEDIRPVHYLVNHNSYCPSALTIPGMHENWFQKYLVSLTDPKQPLVLCALCDLMFSHVIDPEASDSLRVT